MAAADPAAHVAVLAALATGRAFHADGAVPAALSEEALERAERSGGRACSPTR